MFGPLPLLHRIALAVVISAFGVLAGAWVAHVTALPMASSTGAVVGGLLGLGVAFSAAHASHPHPERARGDRRR